MVRLVRPLALVTLCSIVATVLGQGSAGGYGQGGGGGFGGGFGGGGGGLSRRGPVFAGTSAGTFGGDKDSGEAAANRQEKPDDDTTQGLWQSKTAILTPGDRYEIKLVMKKGETVMASVTSDAFDPALSFEDANKAELAKNDDRVEGDQSPFLIYRCTKEGTYTLKVLSFRQVSGGKFVVKFRTFVSNDAPVGKQTFDTPSIINLEGRDRVVFRLAAKKGMVYDLQPIGERRTSPNTFVARIPISSLVGPTGVADSDFDLIPTDEPATVFKAKADGDYYLEYGADFSSKCETDIREIAPTAIKPDGQATFDMAAGELRIIEFPVEPNLIVRTTVTGTTLLQRMTAPVSTVPIGTWGDPAGGNSRVWTWFKMNVDSDSDVVHIFHGTGTARVAIRSQAGTAQKVTFKNSVSLPTWSTGEALKSAIEVGDTRLFLVKSTKSELMRVFAGASHFLPRLDIYRLNGELANSLCDRKTHTAKDDLYFPDADTFVIRLTCDGHGGSGDFEMKRDSLSPAAYALGSAQTLKLDGVNFGLYSVNLEAGKRYQLTTDEPNNFLRADLLDDDGQFLVSQRVQFDKVEVQYFVPTRSGRHRLWLRGQPGTRHFQFALHVPPTIGG